MSTQTPTPHRFLAPAASAKQTSSAKPPSSLHREYAPTPQPDSSSGKQFATTPRFAFGSSHRSSLENGRTHERQLSSSSPFIQRQVPSRSGEEIDDLASDSENDIEPNVLRQPTAPLFSDDIPNEDDHSFPLPVSASRKRPLEQEQIVRSSSPLPPSSPLLPATPQLHHTRRASLSPPTTPPPPVTSASTQHHRFRLPTHSSPTASARTKSNFVLPTAPESPPRTHVSTLLTPQKRGQKFQHGGLAATVRDWVVEASQPLYHKSHRTQDDWDLQLHVEEARRLDGLGSEVMLVRTREINAEQRLNSWALMGKPKGVEERQDLPRHGVINIRRPFWDVNAGVLSWGIAPEWSNFSNVG